MLYHLKKVWIHLFKLYLRKKSAKKVFFVSNYPLLPPLMYSKLPLAMKNVKKLEMNTKSQLFTENTKKWFIILWQKWNLKSLFNEDYTRKKNMNTAALACYSNPTI